VCLLGGILGVSGRLENTQIYAEAKYPNILPNNHHVVDLLIEQYHQLSGQFGCEDVFIYPPKCVADI